ncbi:PREDICTED: odorant receptor 49b-like [Eufriesea mexicana]|uniref:odorant receptor 49b-like n=1 Tax=Eufriesea mexicana TaxID=516756 RepID=UPI00083BB974|nr:PREDICTED: odorant receptor 49b-like [Eufriesea mexicana]
MRLKYPRDLSLSMASFSLKIIGVWLSNSYFEQWFRNVMVVYTISMLAICLCIHLWGLYFSWDDFKVFSYISSNSVGLIMDIFKFLVILLYKKKFLSLITYMQTNFWHLNYDEYEKSIIENAKHICIYFVGVQSFFSQITIFSYIIRPLLSNIGKNETDRIFIFNMYIDMPIYISPYYEIIYLIQALSLYQAGICYISFDNIFFIMCKHLASQFRILRYRIVEMPNLKVRVNLDENVNTCPSSKYYNTFRSCIQQHQSLIDVCAKLEEVFAVIILGQVSIFSILICFIGYQVILANLSLSWRISFICFLLNNICQLWMFTYSCNSIMQESANIVSAVYATPWINLSMDKYGKMIRKDLQLVTMRSLRACCLTAYGFFPISLETCTKIISTAMSYFTLLKQRIMDIADT